MIELSAAEIIRATQGTPLGIADAEAITCTFATTDSREVTDRTLFIAKPGEVTDGSKFVPSAFASGATLALVEHPVTTEDGGVYPAVQVPDAVVAMGQVARYAIEKMRSHGDVQVIGITGSAGKTTTKDLLEAIFSAVGNTVAPVGSYNGEVGVPLTVFRADETTRYLVIEMGADRVGNIDYLANMVRPDYGVILKVGTAHAGEFGGVDNIERTKGELAEGIRAGGALALNADDERVVRMQQRATVPVTYFGVGEKPRYERYVAALDLSTNGGGCPEFTLQLPNGQRYAISAKLIGEHHVYNLLAAATVAYNVGIAGEQIAHALNTAAAVSKWRMARTDRFDGVSVINDAYNANPESMSAALRTLAQLGHGSAGRTWAVLGPMFELGEESMAEHDRIGRLAVRLNISKLVAVGQEAQPIYNAAHLEGSWGNEATWVGTPEEASQLLRAELQPGDIILFKSSNGAKLGQLGDEIALSAEPFGATDTRPSGWLSAGDFSEITDLTGAAAGGKTPFTSAPSQQSRQEGTL